MIDIRKDCKYTLKCDACDLHLIDQAIKIAIYGIDYADLSKEDMHDLEILHDRLQPLFEVI